MLVNISRLDPALWTPDMLRDMPGEIVTLLPAKVPPGAEADHLQHIAEGVKDRVLELKKKAGKGERFSVLVRLIDNGIAYYIMEALKSAKIEVVELVSSTTVNRGGYATHYYKWRKVL